MKKLIIKKTRGTYDVEDSSYFSGLALLGLLLTSNVFWFTELAKKYLAIPATLAASERLFSDAGNVMTVRRTNLLPSTFEHLIFCKRNWRIIGRIFPESE